MNERIKELVYKVWYMPCSDDEHYLALEKFAELIVQECIDCLNPLSRNHSMVGAAQDTIKEHFGVKE